MKLQTYIQRFEERVKKSSDNWCLYKKVGKKLIYKLKRKLKRNPKDTELINLCGIIALEMHDIDLALKMFKKAVQIKPNIQSLNNLAYLHQYEYEDHQKAAELLERVIKMEPDSGVPYGLLGEAYLDLELYEKAEETLEKAINLKTNPSVLNDLGISLYKQNKIKEAAVWFQKVYNHESNVNTENLNPLLSYGVSLAQIGESKDAEKVAEELKLHLKEFLQTGKSMIYLDVGFLEIADIYYECHNYSKACEMFKGAFSAEMRYSMSPCWISQYQYSLLQCGRLEEAEEVQKIVILENQSIIDDSGEKDYYSEEDCQKTIQHFKNKIQEHTNLFNRVKDGYRPPLDYYPRRLGNCSLFGCIRHENPNYSCD